MTWSRLIVVLGLTWLCLAALKYLTRPRVIGRFSMGACASALVGRVPLERVPPGAVQVWRDESPPVKLQLSPPATLDYGPMLEP